jgi:hypothetical protein
MASIMLSGLAMPFQARSKAVPWSTGHAQEGEADGDVDAGEPRPRARGLIEREAQRLHRDMALIVIHGDHDIELAAARAGEQRVGGQRSVHVEALAPRGLDGGDDLAPSSSPNRPSSPRAG